MAGLADPRLAWSLGVVGFAFLLLAVVLLAAMVYVSGAESENERRGWEEARRGD